MAKVSFCVVVLLQILVSCPAGSADEPQAAQIAVLLQTRQPTATVGSPLSEVPAIEERDGDARDASKASSLLSEWAFNVSKDFFANLPAVGASNLSDGVAALQLQGNQSRQSQIDAWIDPMQFLASLTPQEMGILHPIMAALMAPPSSSTNSSQPSSSQAPTDYPYVTLDGETQVEVPANIISDFGQEMFYSFDMDRHGITVNGTHVFIPYMTPLQANYMVRTNPTENIEYGISQLFMDGNAFGSMHPSIKTGTGERMYVLYNKNDPPQDRLWREEAEQQAQTEWERAQADAVNEKRTMLMNLYVALNKVSSQMKVGSAMLPHIQSPLFAFAAQDDGRPNQRIRDGMREMRESSSEFFANRSNYEPLEDKILSRKVACHHWTNGYTPNEGGHYMPLDTKLPMFRGKISSSPYNFWETVAATSVFHYNEETHRLELYYGSAIMGHFKDPLGADPFEPGLFVNPADAGEMPVPPIIRPAIVQPNPLFIRLYHYIQSMPKKYGFWAGGRDSVCPPATFAFCSRWMTSPQYVGLQNAMKEAMMGTPMSPSAQWGFVWSVTKCSACEIEFIKADTKHVGSETYNLFAASAAFHGTSEVIARGIPAGLFATFWNNLSTDAI